MATANSRVTDAEQSTRPAWVLALAGLFISASPVLVKAVDRGQLGSTAVGFYRTALAVPFLILLARWRGESLRISGRMFLILATASLCFASDLYTWHKAIHIVGAGMSTILGNTQVIWLSLFGVLALGEYAGWRLVASVTTAIIGVTLLSGVLAPAGMPRMDLEGLALGIATGLLYAAYLLVLRGSRSGAEPPGPLTVMVWVSGLSALFMLGMGALAGERLVFDDGRTLGLVLALALIVQTFGWWAIASSLPQVPAALAGLLLLLQPVLSTVWGALWFGEALTWLEALGAGLVLLAIQLGTVRRKRPTLPASAAQPTSSA